MISKTIPLWESTNDIISKSNDEPTLTTYILDNIREPGMKTKRPSVVICPGGGYEWLSDREAEPIAARFLAAGFHAFVVRYSVSPARHPQPLLDVSKALWIIRQHAEEWHIETDKITVCGFSAGGHLAASLGVFWNEPYIREAINMPEGMNRPNALILSYPVITSGEHAHRGSFDNLLGGQASEEQLKSMSLELHVNPLTPPTFLWHTFDDGLVPVENSLMFAQELRKQGVPFELHIYPEGPHGLALSSEETAWESNTTHVSPHTATWMPLCIEWLKQLFR